jgi:hypothetical protein
LELPRGGSANKKPTQKTKPHMIEEIQFHCGVCQKEFPADPDTMLEFEIHPLKEGGIPASTGVNIRHDDVETLTALEAAAFGLDESDRQKLLRGESVKVGGCICIECQEEIDA